MSLNQLGVDNLGLDDADRKYLTFLSDHGGGPVGVETIAAALSEPRDAIEEVIEPFLIQEGLIQRTPRGRILGDLAWTSSRNCKTCMIVIINLVNKLKK